MGLSPRAGKSESTYAMLAAEDSPPPPCPCTGGILRDGQSLNDCNRCVLPGEKIILSFECTGHTITDITWTIGGSRVKNYSASLDLAQITNITDADLHGSSVTFYWNKSGDPITVTIDFKADGIDCSKNAQFRVLKPICVFQGIQGVTQLVSNNTKVKLSSSPSSPTAGTQFDASVTMPQKPAPCIQFPMAQWQFVQVGKIRPIIKLPGTPSLNRTSSLANKTLCDTAYPYPSPAGQPAPPFQADATGHYTVDNPEYPLNSQSYVKIKSDDDGFSMFVMFRPSGGIWVPLKVIDWGWSFCVSWVSGSGWSLFSPGQYMGSAQDEPDFVEWNGHLVPNTPFDLTYLPPVAWCGN